MGIPTPQLVTSINEQNKNKQHQGLFIVPTQQLSNLAKTQNSNTQGFNLDVGGSNYNVQPAQYTPAAQLSQATAQNIGSLLSQPTLASKGNLFQYTPEDFQNLPQAIYGGIKTEVEQQREEAQKRLEETLAKTGLYRSGINLENQQKLEKSAIDALAKGWGQAALQAYSLQSDLAKSQAYLDQEISKYNTEIQNAVRLHAFDKLMEANAIDQDAINKARQFNVTIKNAYDELAFKWAASLLDQEIREYAAKLDLIAKAQAANAQYGTKEAKTQWNTLAYQYAQPLNTSTLEASAYNNAVADLTNQINQLQGQVNSLQNQNQQLQNQLNTLRQPQSRWWRIIDGA